MRKVLLLFIVSLLLLILAGYGWFHAAIHFIGTGGTQVSVSERTTHIVEPLDETGMVDFLEAINQRTSEGVTPENNAAVLLWQAAGPAKMPQGLRAEFFERLGIDPLPDEGDYFVTFNDFVQSHPELLPSAEEGDDTDGDSTPETLAALQFDEAMRRPWSAEEFPLLAAWLEASEGPLKLISAAAVRTRYYSPPLRGDHPPVLMALLPDLQLARESAYALNARAMFRLDRGYAEAAWRDLRTCHCLAAHLASRPQFIPLLVAIAIDGIASDGDLAIARHRSLSPSQRRLIWQSYRALPSWPDPIICIDYGERIASIDAVIDMSRGSDGFAGEEDIDSVSLWSMQHVIDWNAILVAGNVDYDTIVSACRLPTYTDRMAALRRIQDDVDARNDERRRFRSMVHSAVKGEALSHFSESIGDILFSLMGPPSKSFLNATTRHECKRQLVDIAFALEQYRADHQESYPDALSELVPRYLAELPKDKFTEDDLKYRRTDVGYLLYSIGPNQHDDEGRSEWKDEDSEGDDIAVCFPLVEVPVVESPVVESPIVESGESVD